MGKMFLFFFLPQLPVKVRISQNRYEIFFYFFFKFCISTKRKTRISEFFCFIKCGTPEIPNCYGHPAWNLSLSRNNKMTTTAHISV